MTLDLKIKIEKATVTVTVGGQPLQTASTTAANVAVVRKVDSDAAPDADPRASGTDPGVTAEADPRGSPTDPGAVIIIITGGDATQ